MATIEAPERELIASVMTYGLACFAPSLASRAKVACPAKASLPAPTRAIECHNHRPSDILDVDCHGSHQNAS
ncbi:hypothetical protein WJX77_006092 [Trebouxia sp. C0004]